MGMNEKVTLTLPHELMEEVRAMSSKRGQSKFISEAVAYFIEVKQRKLLREELIAGYQAAAAESLAMTEEWAPIDEESWSLHLPPYEGEEPFDDAPNQTR